MLVFCILFLSVVSLLIYLAENTETGEKITNIIIDKLLK
jgi:hypothetical protein